MEMTIEQQRAMALARARLRMKEQGSPYRQPGQEQEQRPGFMEFVNQGIASGLGAPVDMVTGVINAGISGANMIFPPEQNLSGLITGEAPAPRFGHIQDPFGGSASINRGMSGMGVPVAPPEMRAEGFMENIGAGLGGAAGALVPFSAGAKAVQGLGGAAGAAGEAILSPFIQTPGRAIATELAAGAGAGAGIDVAQNLAPGNPYAEIGGALIGGGVAGLTPNLVTRAAPYVPGIGLATRATQAAVAPFTKAGALVRARNRIAGLVEDPDAARAALTQENIGGLSPATQTGERRLMALEQQVRNTDPTADATMRGREAETNRLFNDELAAVGGDGSIADTRSFLSDRVGGLVTKMDEAVERASQRAEDQLALLTPSQRQSASSVIVREEIDAAHSAARQQENQLWTAIPESVEVPTEATYAAYKGFVNQLSRAELDTLPPKVAQFLGDTSNTRFGDFETVKEMHGLYSELRKASRQARAAGEFNTARIADGVADAIIEDIGAKAGNVQGQAGAAMRDAIDFSREVNQVYRQGSIGKVLGYAREGGQSLPAELTLDSTVGRQGTRGAVNLDEVRRATNNSPATEAAVRDYTMSNLQNTSVRNGELNPRATENFLVRNDELLAKMPETREQIAGALAANQSASAVDTTMAARRAAVTQDSQAGRLLLSPQGKEIANLYRSEAPQASAAQLVRQAQADPSGAALAGLKGAFIDDVIGAATSRQFDEAGNSVLSGNAARAHLSDPKVQSVAGEMLSPTEQSRLEQIVDAMQKADLSRSGLPDVGPVINDTPNNIISLIFRTLAARQGAKAGAGTSGASLLTANFASRRMEALLDKLTNNKAEQLIREAIMGDREMFDTLLANPSTIKPAQISRLVEFMMGTGGALSATGDGNGEPLRIVVDGANPISYENYSPEIGNALGARLISAPNALSKPPQAPNALTVLGSEPQGNALSGR